MGQIKVAFDGKPLFNWEGDAIEIERCETKMAEMAAYFGKPEVVIQQKTIRYIARDVGHFRNSDSTDQGSMMFLVICFLLSRRTNRPDHPGYYRDYVPLWDFSFDICEKPDGSGLDIQVRGDWTAVGQA
jgi:hypothetical protein